MLAPIYDSGEDNLAPKMGNLLVSTYYYIPLDKSSAMLNYGCKNIILIFLFTLNLLVATSQTEYFVKVNSTTGTFTKINSIPGVVRLQSYSTYNETNKEYTVLGTVEPGQSPTYLYSLNSETGIIQSQPLVPNPNKIISLQYSKLTGVLYGIVIENGVYYVASVNKTAGTYTLINSIPNIDGVGEFIIDEVNQTLILPAVDNNPAYALWTINLSNGNIIYHVSTKPIFELQYDKTTHKIYALTSRLGPITGSNSIWSICTVDPPSGTVSIIADLPEQTGILPGHSTYNEKNHLFIFAGPGQTPAVLLYSVDVSNGNIISKPQIPSSGVIENDNLIFFRYDNLSDELYGLLWEAKKATPPPVAADSGCKIKLETKIYPNPTGNVLTINKNPTVCKVIMNLYNTAGQLILTGKNINDGYNEIHLSYLAAGIYYYQFTSGNKVLLTGKFFKD